MKNIKFIKQEKYNDKTKFERVSEGIYKSLINYEDNIVEKGQYVTSLSFTLEESLNEMADREYPLEDLLDLYLAHVSEFVQDEADNPIMILELCTQGWLDNMEELITIVGKRIYNREKTKDGKTTFELVIE